MASVWVLVLVSCAATCNVFAEGNPERESLISFKNSLENPRVLFSWNGTTPHCNWVGVTCELGRVVSLSLPALFLKGPLSPSLFTLPSLTVLDLSSNRFYDQIPPQISTVVHHYYHYVAWGH
ncbi:hypothetical protein Patl1_05186 [Pistacia atlantica]|uniref:Uncharacterized protein n=1 Tax=Pistacia atlantica TaxID=434234 RepID=A0ACC1BV75_9ROSI|nr:hypothetical protein Patl1_05186 [Pistacia atlantica]